MRWGCAALLGAIGSAGSAERVHTRFEWTAMPEGLAALAAVVVAVAGGVAVVTLYRRERAGAGPGYVRWVCCGLRILCLAILGVILLRPSVARDLERIVPGRLLILADRSASMSVRDAQLPDELRRNWAAALGLAAPERIAELTRHDILRALLERDGVALVRESSRANQVELMTFADDVRAVLKVARRAPEQEGADQSSAGDVTIPRWDPTGSRTDLGGALRAAIEQPAPERVAGVVVLTDGRDTEGGDLEAVARDAADRGIPLHFVGIGSPLAPRNVALTELVAAERAMRGLTMAMRAIVRSDGYAGQSVRLALTATDLDSNRSEEVVQKAVVLAGEGTRQTVDLTHVPETAGTIRYAARIEPLEGESRADDNTATAEVVVTEEKIRVLLIAGAPSREYRFLKSLISRDPAFDLTVRLRGAAAGSGVVASMPHDGQGLPAYDVIVACDPSPEDFSARWVEALADVVDKEGLGLAFLAGPTYTPELVADQALQRLRDLLPVRADMARNRALIGGADYFTQSWPVELAEEAAGHPITNPGPGVEPAQFWNSLPGLYWVLPVERAKPGATVLLRHGDRMSGYSSERGTVLAAVQSYGLGRVFYCGCPETWRWRRRGIEYHERFWLQALHYCAAGRPAGRQGRAGIELDRSVYALGEAVRIRARLLDSGFRPIQDGFVELGVVRDNARVGSVRMRQAAGESGLYEGVFYPGGFGRFELTYAAPDGLVVAEPFEVKWPEVEFDDVRMARLTMQRLADVTGGRYFEPSELDELAGAIPDRSRAVIEPGPLKPLWDTPYLLAMLVAALGTEWLLRKRMGML